jgi:hypothetical protein
LTLSPRFDDTKQMSVTGSVAVYEKVAVTVTGVVEDGAVPAGLVLRLVSQCGRYEYARYPYNLGDVWGVSGDDATCVLDLGTSAVLRGYFARLSDGATVEAQVKLENGVTSNLYASGFTLIRNWIQNPLDPVAGSSQLQAQLDVLTARIAEHQHDDSPGSASFPHNHLSGRDTAGAHPTIEGAIVTLAASVGTAQSTAEVAGENASEALATAQTAKAVTDTIQDGGAFSLVASNATLAQTKALLNQIATILNTWRHT